MLLRVDTPITRSRDLSLSLTPGTKRGDAKVGASKATAHNLPKPLPPTDEGVSSDSSRFHPERDESTPHVGGPDFDKAVPAVHAAQSANRHARIIAYRPI